MSRLAKVAVFKSEDRHEKTRAPQPFQFSELIGVSAKLSVVLISSFILVGCGDDEAPPVQWFMDNPSEINRALISCNHSTKYNPMPHYTWCSNAKLASITISMRLRDLEKEKKAWQLQEILLRTLKQFIGMRVIVMHDRRNSTSAR
jgi:hypothetical protein